MLVIGLLGAPTVERDGRAVSFDTRKAVALLAYLAVTARPHRRDALSALCWPEADRQRGHAALRRTLSVLRSGVGKDALVVERGTVALAHGAWRCDLDQARGALAACRAHGHVAEEVCPRCIEPLGEAVALHRGRFLEGFALRDSTAYDEWQDFTAEEIREELTGALDRLTVAKVRVGDLDGALQAARRRLGVNQLSEAAHQALIRCYAWNDQRDAALRQYRECVKILDRELGVAPLAETHALYRSVLEHRLPGPGTEHVPAASPRDGSRPLRRALARGWRSGHGFAGRDVELARLVEVVDALDTDGHLVVVEGEAGIGKTGWSRRPSPMPVWPSVPC